MELMKVVATALVMVLAANAVVAFLIAFFWQAKVIFVISDASDRKDSYILWKALAKKDSPQNMFGRFLAGEIYPELRQRWWKAVTYLLFSFTSVMVVAGLLKIFAPELLM